MTFQALGTLAMLGSGAILASTLATAAQDARDGRFLAAHAQTARRDQYQEKLIVSYRNPQSFERNFVSALASGP
ncbi:hypothetical protein CHLRE_02g095140v5 [Chlamydomonas reinhardtii]|jgi:hypothetical protein|uniref:Uncharacterized protein n=1 Tax=Chlamydomonas reinhardtii TaxID=3055 RepID=A0A2K3E1U3_CHLRE|nr:uncharacterized protein CHLRE_02g095140v5 [Chlamydomonas reinhardtii]PNW86758.1 hypothetical protein CHLRE_02g095140v5 [Chlamydomonas reinhardtii]